MTLKPCQNGDPKPSTIVQIQTSGTLRYNDGIRAMVTRTTNSLTRGCKETTTINTIYIRGGKPFQSEGQMRLSGAARGPE